jgi:hypothetical protein
MPPQGESTGYAIEDGVLIAHLLQSGQDRTAEQLVANFETVRRPVIGKYYRDALWVMEHGFAKRSWLMSIPIEWGVWMYLLVKKWSQENHFAGDVRDIKLPPE